MIKPFRPLLLLIYVVVLLAVVLHFLPSEWSITDQITLRSFSMKSLFEKQSKEYADISSITSAFSVSDSLAAQSPAQKRPVIGLDTHKTVLDSLKTLLPLESKYQIQVPEDDSTVLYKFFSSLRDQAPTQLIRVLHYGDSQIEGDRISSYLRHRLQNQFGGCGLGLVPLLDVVGSRLSIVQYSDAEWQKIYAFSSGFQNKYADSYGVMGSVFTYGLPKGRKENTLRLVDTIRYKTQPQIYVHRKAEGAMVTYAELERGYPLDKQGKIFKLLYRNHEAPFQLSIQEGNDSLRTIQMDTSSRFRIFKYNLHKDFDKLTVTFNSKQSPELFSAAIDCDRGVAVDNIPFRGSSGMEFSRMNKQLLAEQVRALNVRMIILQFGVNIVPYIQQDYKSYENQYYRQLQILKELAPEASILVIGLSDMSRREGGGYASYPNIEKIRDAQRKAAFRAGCAFWDTYVAMGGKNSMPSWVASKPALAKPDYIHFTPRGAMIISEMLYKAILKEYIRFDSQPARVAP